MERKNSQALHLVLLMAAFALLVGGCASDGALSTQKIGVGEKAISVAKDGNASLNAPRELDAAEGKLAQAKEAFAKKDYEKASALAEQASIDAEYAQTKATAEKNKKAVEEMRKNIDTLRQEIERLSKN
jgi:septal ring factor EnvC (AmiA/AmiB activator)